MKFPVKAFFPCLFFWYSSSCVELPLAFTLGSLFSLSLLAQWSCMSHVTTAPEHIKTWLTDPCHTCVMQRAATALQFQYENRGTEKQLVPGHTGSFWQHSELNLFPKSQSSKLTIEPPFFYIKYLKLFRFSRQRHMFKPENCLNWWMPQMSTSPATPCSCR